MSKPNRSKKSPRTPAWLIERRAAQIASSFMDSPVEPWDLTVEERWGWLNALSTIPTFSHKNSHYNFRYASGWLAYHMLHDEDSEYCLDPVSAWELRTQTPRRIP